MSFPKISVVIHLIISISLTGAMVCCEALEREGGVTASSQQQFLDLVMMAQLNNQQLNQNPNPNQIRNLNRKNKRTQEQIATKQRKAEIKRQKNKTRNKGTKKINQKYRPLQQPRRK